MDYAAMGQRIREMRKARRLSQEETAHRAQISTTHMSHIETGNTKLSLTVLVDLSEILGVRTDDIIFEAKPCSAPVLLQDITELLNGCSEEELLVIRDTVSALLDSMHKHLK